MRTDSYKNYWHMQEKAGVGAPGKEVFRCMDCGAVTRSGNGWNGSPDPSQCKNGCSSPPGDWINGKVADAYRENFDKIFPDAPGAGL